MALTKFVVRSKLPLVAPCSFVCSPAVSDEQEARVVLRLLVHESNENRVVSTATMSPEEARDVAARLLKVAEEAEALRSKRP